MLPLNIEINIFPKDKKKKNLYFGFKPLLLDLFCLQMLYTMVVHFCGGKKKEFDDIPQILLFPRKILDEVTQWTCSIARKMFGVLTGSF